MGLLTFYRTVGNIQLARGLSAAIEKESSLMARLGTLDKKKSTETRSATENVAAEDRASEVLMAAADLFYHQGFDATSMNDIANAVKLTKAGLYYYTKGKGDLLYKIMRFAMDRVERDIIIPCREIADSEQRLTQIVTRHLDAIVLTGGAITILTGEVDKLTAPQKRAIIGRKRQYFDLVCSTLKELQAAGRLRDLDIRIASLNLFSTVLGVARWYDPKGRFSRERLQNEILQFILSALLKDRLHD